MRLLKKKKHLIKYTTDCSVCGGPKLTNHNLSWCINDRCVIYRLMIKDTDGSKQKNNNH